jgi:hypothetical protein
MRNVILNKTLSVPIIFFLLLCFKGGDLAAWVMESTNLSAWLEANKLGITFTGADYSTLPAVAVIAGILSGSLLIHFVIEVGYEAFDALTAAPANTTAVPVAEQAAKPAPGAVEKQEPTVDLPPVDSRTDQEKH